MTLMRGSTLGTIVYVLAGPIAWAVHVTVIYGFQSTACAVHPSPEWLVDIVVTIATAIAAAVSAFVALRHETAAHALGAGGWPDETRQFTRRVMTLLALLSIFGIVGAGAATFILPACDMMR